MTNPENELDQRLDSLQQTADWLSVKISALRREIQEKKLSARSQKQFRDDKKLFISKVTFEIGECEKIIEMMR